MIEQLDMFGEIYEELPKWGKVLKLGTFFSGIGAPEKALKNIGIKYELQFFSEVDKYAIKSYCALHNERKEKCLGSISDIKGEQLPYCDLWFGGFPCTDISLAGQRKGWSFESNTRSSLGWEMIRLLREVKDKPKYILFENVSAIFNETHRPILNLFKLDLEKLGYTLHNDILNAKDYGIPQHRSRYFLIATLGKYNYKFPTPIKLNLTLKDMLEDEVDNKYYLNSFDYIFTNSKKDIFDRNKAFLNKEVAYTLNTKPQRRVGDSNYIYENNNREQITMGEVKEEYLKIKEATKKGYAEAVEGDGVDLNYLDSKTRRGRVQKQKAHTLTTSKSLGVVTNDMKIRYLTPLESFKLMGFDQEDYIKASKVVSEAQLYKQAGNSIVVNVLEHIFKNLLNGGE